MHHLTHPLIGPKGIWFGGWTKNQLFIRGSVGLKEQEVTLRVNMGPLPSHWPERDLDPH